MSIRRTPLHVMLSLLIVAALSLAAAGAPTPSDEYSGGSYIITPEELLQLLGDDNLRIYDFQALGDYLNGHIPGAMHFDTTLLVNDDNFDYEFAGIENAEIIFSAAGISMDDVVVLYWGNHSDATYVFWALDYLGHPDVRILNGGIEGWIEHGYELATGYEDYPVADFKANVNEHRYAALEYVQANLNNASVDFVDARPRAAYEQEHLPVLNDFNLPFSEVFDEDGYLKAPEALNQVVVDTGLAFDREVVTYCTRGRLASQLYWALKVAGHQTVRNFEASMMGWNAAGLPVATGSPTR